MDLHNYSSLINAGCAAGLLITGYFVARQIGRLVERAMTTHFSRHHVMLVSRGLFYLVLILFSITSLQHLGFNLSVLLGAAGVFTVAISFASQTAASNLISGIFLLFERPFKMGDNIEIKGINGIVESIDLLSTKIKTSDNKLVRVPNEALIKSEITNLSYFKTRRVDLLIRVAYSTDVEQVKAILLSAAGQCEHVLPEPVPCVYVNRFVDSAIELKFTAWTQNEQYSSVKNHLQESVKQQFDLAGVEMPSPLVTINQV